jgi:small subunit ribosomal protein S17
VRADRCGGGKEPGVSEQNTQQTSAEPLVRRRLIGRVYSDKMDKTVVVEVVRSKLDQVYKKYVRTRRRYHAHDEQNECRVGDRVEIIEHRPLSRLKRWKISAILERASQ